MITINGKEFRNLVEQVLKNKEDIYNYHNLEQVLADWGIKVLGQLDEWEEPTGSFEFGDAYAVGTEPPYDYYIYTRRGENEGYWFNNGPISIVGPAGPAGESIVGPRGYNGSQIYIGPTFPTGEIRENDMYINTDYDLFTYTGTEWQIKGNIKGADGDAGVSITGAEVVSGNLIIKFSNGQTTNAGYVKGADGQNGQDGKSAAVDIIGTLEADQDIDAVYPVEEQEPNAGVLVKIEGFENEYNLYIIIDGVWTNTGRYGGGSTVYEGGEYVQYFNADTKLDKVSGTGDWRVYAITNTGAQTTQGFGSTQLEAGIIVSRREGGHVLVPLEPANSDKENQNNHAVSFSYLKTSQNALKPKSLYWASSSNTAKSVNIDMPTGFSSFTTAPEVALPVYITYIPTGVTMAVVNRGKLIIKKNTKQWAVYDLESASPTDVLFSGSFTQVTFSSTRIGLTGMAPAVGHPAFLIEIPYLGAQSS